jgi:hypothetical protein
MQATPVHDRGVFEKSKRRREARHDHAVAAVRQMREDGYFFEMKPLMVGNRSVEEVVIGDQTASWTFERTQLIADAIGMNIGKHGGIVGKPQHIAIRLGAVIADAPDGLPKVLEEIRVLVESWREAGEDDATIRVGLLRSDILRSRHLQVDKVIAMLRESTLARRPVASNAGVGWVAQASEPNVFYVYRTETDPRRLGAIVVFGEDPSSRSYNVRREGTGARSVHFEEADAVADLLSTPDSILA